MWSTYQRAGAPRPVELAGRGLILAAMFAILLATARAVDDSPSTEPSSTVLPTKSPTPSSTSEASTEKANLSEKDEGEIESVQPGEQHQVAILKQINRVNDDGSYTFGYEAADGSFKIETRDVLGHVKGMFGYIDEQGNVKRVSYSAANGTGFSQANGIPEGATIAAETDVPKPLYHQVVRSALESSGPTGAATEVPVEPPTRPPVLIVPRQRLIFTSTQRPEVIQTIPRRNEPLGQPEVHFVPRKESVTSPAPLPPRRHHLVTPRPQPDGSTPTPAPYGQYIREPVMEVFVTRSNSSVGGPVTSTTRRPVLVLATPIPGQPLKRLLVTRRPYEVHQPSELPPADDAVDAEIVTTTSLPVEGREGNDLRRQLGPDRDIDPIGLVPGVNQLFKIRQPGTADAGDVYPSASGGAAGGPLPLSSSALGSTPLANVLTQHPRALHNEYLQRQILGDLDLRPRVRPAHDAYPVYDERPTVAPTRLPPPPQHYPQPSPPPPPAPSVSPPHGYTSGPTVLPPLEPSIARALEQFLLARGIRLKVNSQPVEPEPVDAYDPYVPAPVYPRRPAYTRVPYVPVPSRYRGYDPYYEGDAYDYDPYIPRPTYYMRRVPATYLPVPVAPAPAPGYDRYDRYDDPVLVPANRYMDARYPAGGSDELLIRMLLGGRTRALVQPEIQLSDYETSVASATSTSSPQTTTTQVSQSATDRGRSTYHSSSTTPAYSARRRPTTPRTVIRSVPSTGARNVRIIEPEPTAESERIVTSTRAQ